MGSHPQGSVLGFIIFIDKFADDTKFISRVGSAVVDLW